MTKFYFTKYEVSSTTNKRIVLISDIHYYNKKMYSLLENIYLNINAAKPDCICIPGDFIDERSIYDEEIFLNFLKKLGTICPVIISIGNHETKTKHDHLDQLNVSFMNQIDKIENIHLLNNTSWVHENIRFTGLTFPYESYTEKKESSKVVWNTLNEKFDKGVRKDKFNIVLSHSPYCLLYKKVKEHKLYQSADLVLCGHTHGGLTPPFLYRILNHAFISPQRHLFPKNSYGYLKEEKTIVSSGITKLSHMNPFRHFNFLFSSEIVIIELKK